MREKTRLQAALEEHFSTVWRCASCGFAGWAPSFLWRAGCPVCGCGVRYGSAALTNPDPCLYCGLGGNTHAASCTLQPVYAAATKGLGTPAPTAESTLAEARRWVAQHRGKGVRCPCCQRYARVYKRPLNYSMAYALMLIYEYFADHSDWLHVPTYLNGKGVVARGGDWAKMVYWGLIVGSGGIRADESKRVGNYKITEKGINFVEGRISVPSYVVVYNARVIGKSDSEIYIHQALGEHFNYAAMMDGVVARVGSSGIVPPPVDLPEHQAQQLPIWGMFQEQEDEEPVQ